MITKENYVLGLFMDPSSFSERVLLGEESVECLPENFASALYIIFVPLPPWPPSESSLKPTCTPKHTHLSLDHSPDILRGA